MGNIHTPESVKECNEELKFNLPKVGIEYSQRDEEHFAKDYKGAEDLQEFLKYLPIEQYEVQFTNPTKGVVIITKK